MHRLPNDNCIVHHNAERQQKGKQRDHVEALTGIRQEKQGPHVSHNNAHRHPECEHGPQKQHQHNND